MEISKYDKDICLWCYKISGTENLEWLLETQPASPDKNFFYILLLNSTLKNQSKVTQHQPFDTNIKLLNFFHICIVIK